MKLMASLAPARAELEAGAVAKADQCESLKQCGNHDHLSKWS